MSPQPDPELAVRLFRSSGQLCITVEVHDAVNAEVLKLVNAGNRLQLGITIAGPLSEASRTFTHGIAFDPVQQLYTVDISETAAHHTTTNQQAAIDIFGRFFGLNLAPEEDIRFPAVIDVSAGLAPAEPVSFDLAVLWNYHTPRFHIEFSSISDYQPGLETSR